MLRARIQVTDFDELLGDHSDGYSIVSSKSDTVTFSQLRLKLK